MRRKLLSAVLATAMSLVSLTACGGLKAEETPEAQTTEAETTDEVQATTTYDVAATNLVTSTTPDDTDETKGAVDGENDKITLMLDDVRKALAGEYGDDPSELEGLGISTIFMMTNDYQTLGYLIEDIDGDGNDELILGGNAIGELADDSSWKSVIYNIFVIKGGEMYTVVNGHERDRYYLCEDGTIANEASGGASTSAWFYYKLDGNELKPVDTIFDSLGDDGETITWYRNSSCDFQDKSNEITEEEAWKVIDGYKYRDLKFIPF